MRARLVAFLADVFSAVVLRVWEQIQRDIRYCDHGYIGVTCEVCAARWRER